jgi:hypothetical protein
MNGVVQYMMWCNNDNEAMDGMMCNYSMTMSTWQGEVHGQGLVWPCGHVILGECDQGCKYDL